MVREYIPDRGDVIWLSFEKTHGHEQRGRRPALVLSPCSYNRTVGLAIVCPITSVFRGYLFSVEIQGNKVHGSVLADQVQSAAWKERRARFIEITPESTLVEVTRRLSALIGVRPSSI